MKKFNKEFSRIHVEYQIMFINNHLLIFYRKQILLQSILLLLYFSVYAQTTYEKELLQSLDTASSDIITSTIYAALSDESVYDNPNRGFQYAEKALYFAEKSNDTYSLAYANSCLGYCLYYKAQYKKALPYFLKDYELYQSIQDTIGLIFSLGHQGDIYSYLGDNKTAIRVLNDALQLSKHLKNDYEISQVYNRMGMIYAEIGELNKGLDLLNRAYEIDLQLEDLYGLDRTLNNLSLIFSEMGNFKDAFVVLKKSIETGNFSKKDYEYGIYLTNMGSIFQRIGLLDSALSYQVEYLKIAREYENLLDEAFALNEIANIQLELGNQNEAYENIQKAIIIYKNQDTKTYLIDGYVTLGMAYLKQKKYIESIQIFEKAENLAKSIRSKNQTAEVLSAKGQVYSAKKDYDKAMKLFLEASIIFKTSGSKAKQGETLYFMAKNLKEQGNIEEAIDTCQQSLKIIQQIKYRVFLERIYELLSACYAANNDFEQAYLYHIEFKNIQDSLRSLAQSNRLAELQTVFNVSEKEAENRLLKSIQEENKIIIQRRTVTGLGLVVCLLALALLAFWLSYKNQERKQYNEALEEEVKERTKELQILNNDLYATNKELERFAYIASHDLKEPLRNIAGFTFLLKQKIKNLLTEETLEYMSFIEKSTKQMNELIVNVLEFSRLNGNKLDLTIVNMNEVINNIMNSIFRTIKSKNVSIEIESLPQITADETKITLILKNLIENGIKYNKNIAPIIHVGYESDEQNHIFYVKDNGIGIKENYNEVIFEMFKRLHTKQEYDGTGIGLAFCKKIVHQHNGRIWLDESGDNGSVFKFSIPKNI